MSQFPESYETERRSGVRAVLSFIAALVIIGGGLAIAAFLFMTAPKAEQAREDRAIPAVELMEITASAHRVHIHTQGVVESRRITRISPEITGRVLEISPNLKQGGQVTAGEVLVSIEETDFRAALARANASLADAELILVQEEARSSQALIDWKRLGRGGDGNPLVLRKPQLTAAQTMVESAREEAARAMRDLERATITAPFAGAIREANAEVGSIARPGQVIADLYSTDDLEVRLPLPLEDLGFVQRDENGRPTGEIVLTGLIGAEKFSWPAESLKLDPEIDRRTLSGHWIVRVMPAADSAWPLPPVGLFVQAAITCGALDGVVEVPRRAIREGDEALVVTPENRIEFRKLDIIRRTRDFAIVRSGLKPGDRLCLTRLNAAVAGMEVRPGTADEN